MILDDENFNKENICIVTGSGSGIGRATAIEAAMKGLHVIGLDVNGTENLQTVKLVEDSGGCMNWLTIDLCDEKEIKYAIKFAACFGNIKYLINIAGIQYINSIEDFPLDTYDKMQNLMVRAPFLLSKLCIPHMKKNGGGVIANMTSIHSHICTKNKSAYNIAKHGLIGLTKSIAAEGEGKIRSFSVSTGFVKTPLMQNQIKAQAKQRGITEEEVIQDVMLGRSQIKEMMSPEEVANLIIFGISKYGKYINGGDLLADGGVVTTY